MNDLKNYFEEKSGFGVLSTAGAKGDVNAAVYSRPHFMADGTIAFIMQDRLSHKNVSETGKAHYLFREQGSHYDGKRMALTMLRESDDPGLIEDLRRRRPHEHVDKLLFVVFFKIENVSPLIGSGPNLKKSE